MFQGCSDQLYCLCIGVSEGLVHLRVRQRLGLMPLILEVDNGCTLAPEEADGLIVGNALYG